MKNREIVKIWSDFEKSILFAIVCPSDKHIDKYGFEFDGEYVSDVTIGRFDRSDFSISSNISSSSSFFWLLMLIISSICWFRSIIRTTFALRTHKF